MAHDAFRALVNLSDSPMIHPYLLEQSFLTFLVSYIVASFPLGSSTGLGSWPAAPSSNSWRTRCYATLQSHSLSEVIGCPFRSSDPCSPDSLVCGAVLSHTIPCRQLCTPYPVSGWERDKCTRATSTRRRVRTGREHRFQYSARQAPAQERTPLSRERVCKSDHGTVYNPLFALTKAKDGHDAS